MLPVEMLERIFWLLPPQDLKMVVLVSRRWREVGESPGLWARFCLIVTQTNLSIMPELLGSRRLQAVRELRVKSDNSQLTVSDELLQEVLKHQGLKVLDLGGTFCNLLTTVEPGLLARAVTKMEEVNLSCTGLTWEQVQAIITAVCQGSNKLKKLDLTRTYNIQIEKLMRKETEDRSEIELLAIAVNRLENVKLWLTSQQAEAILRQSLVQTSLTSLNFSIEQRNFWSKNEDLIRRAKRAIGNLKISF